MVVIKIQHYKYFYCLKNNLIPNKLFISSADHYNTSQ